MTEIHASSSTGPHVADTSKYLREHCCNVFKACRTAVSSWVTGITVHMTANLAAPEITTPGGTVPITLTAITIIIVQLQRSQDEPRTLPGHVPYYSVVPGQYAPGSYYAWLLNTLIVAFQAEPTSPESQSYTLTATLVTASYSIAAAIDQLNRVLRTTSFSQPILDASDRINQVGWIIATFHLLYRCFGESLTTPRPVMLKLAAVIWTLAWLSHTVAITAYNVHRGDLGTRVLESGILFIVGIPLPLATVYTLKRYEWLHWNNPNWATVTINAEALTIAVAYVSTPRQFRYDADSPTAPLAATSLASGDQIAALATGCMTVVPHIVCAWEEGRTWVAAKLRAIRFNDTLAAATVSGEEISSLCRTGTMWLLERLYEAGNWVRKCMISFVKAIGIYTQDRLTGFRLASRTSRDPRYDSMV